MSKMHRLLLSFSIFLLIASCMDLAEKSHYDSKSHDESSMKDEGPQGSSEKIGEGSVSLPSDIALVVEKLKAPLQECPEKLWPGMQLDDSQILFTLDKEAFLWPLHGQKLQKIDYDSLAAQFRTGLYSFGEYKEKKTMSIALDLWPSSHAASFVLHEGFHYFVQPFWPTDSLVNSSREQSYPLQASPRYYRYMMSLELAGYLRQDHSDLGRIRFWYDRYQEEFTEEALSIRRTDVMEGTAKFVDSIGVQDSFCSRSLEEITQQALLSIEPTIMPSDVDSESYTIGALAGLTLSMVGKDGWKNKVSEESKTPLEVLMENVVAAPQQEDPAQRALVEEQVELENEYISRTLLPAVESLESDETILIFAPSSMVLGSYSVGGFTRYPEKELSFRLNLEATFQASSGSGTYQLDGVTVAESGNNPCQDWGYLFAVPKDTFQNGVPSEDGILNLNTQRWKANFVSFRHESDDLGRTWLCL